MNNEWQEIWLEVKSGRRWRTCGMVLVKGGVCCFKHSGHITYLFNLIFVGFCQWTCWQRASHTVSKERGGDYRAMASCQGVLREGWKRVKEGGFDWWMVWKWVSWGGSSTPINVGPCTHPSCVRNSLTCIKANVFLPAQPISWCWHVCCQVWTLCKAFRKWNGFCGWPGMGEMAALQWHHPHTACHVKLCIFLSSESWLKQCAFKKCSLCLWNCKGEASVRL